MTQLDPRLHAFRPDLADERLWGQVDAARFVAGTPAWVHVYAAPVVKAPQLGLGRETEALYGEAVRVFERGNTFCWVQLSRDGYVGYIETAALTFAQLPASTHMVATRGGHVYTTQNMKLPAVTAIPFGAQLCVVGEEAGYAQLLQGSFVAVGQLSTWCRPEHSEGSPTDCAQTLGDSSAVPQNDICNILTVAQSFLGVPYLWGGKTHMGIDCSGLVQMAFGAAGIAMPRDSDMQAACGQAVELAQVHAGDLLFWRGHVAIALDGGQIIHANAHHMAVTIEPITDAIARIKAKGDELVGIKRIVS